VPELIGFDASHLPASVVHRRPHALGELGRSHAPVERYRNILEKPSERPAGGNDGRFKFSPAIPWDCVGIEIAIGMKVIIAVVRRPSSKREN
jgi:hypothetical protein